MSATPNWAEVVVAGAAIAAAIIALMARNDAKRSADEAADARKIARADLLNVHFQNVAYLLDVASDKVGGEAKKLGAGKQSVEALRAFIQDADLESIFARLPALLDRSTEAHMRALTSLPVPPLPADINTLGELFERKRRQYLGIQ